MSIPNFENPSSLNNNFCIFALVKHQTIMAPKKVSKASPKAKGKTAKRKPGIAGLFGMFKGRIHYKDDSIFNLD